jgi:hypothetical protein
MYMDPSLVYEPGKFDRDTLQPLYKRVFDESILPAGSASK